MLMPEDLLNNSQAYFELKVLKFESEGDNRIKSYKGSKRLLVDEDQKLTQDKMEFTWEVKDYSPTEIKIQLQFKNAN